MFKVDEVKCAGCGACVNSCPQGAITMVNYIAVINGSKCTECGRCYRVCPQGAIYLESQTLNEIPKSQDQAFINSRFSRGNGMGRGSGRGQGKGMDRGGGGRGKGKK